MIELPLDNLGYREIEHIGHMLTLYAAGKRSTRSEREFGQAMQACWNDKSDTFFLVDADYKILTPSLDDSELVMCDMCPECGAEYTEETWNENRTVDCAECSEWGHGQTITLG